MRNTLKVCLTLLLPVLIASTGFCEDYQTVLDETFDRGYGAPVVAERIFDGYYGNALVILLNGGAENDEAEKVSSSVVSINGIAVFDATNFNQNVESVSDEVILLEGSNAINVLLRSKPYGTVRIVVKQDFDLLDRDGDGYIPQLGAPNGGDCDDENEAVHPGAAELCNDADDNCDGRVNEGFSALGQTCNAGVGECSSEGLTVCSADGVSTQCDAVPGPPSQESCDGLDNDCDGEVDNGFDVGASCGAGVCAGGTTVCSAAGNETVCSTTFLATEEICNGQDDDCDGVADEDFANLGQPCTSGIGECAAAGIWVCSGNGGSTECDAAAGTPTPELCDGLDNDCNGQTDELAACFDACPDDPLKTEAGICGCGVPDVDSDGDGFFACLDDCDDAVGSVFPGAEDIPGNGIDEDCDGVDSVAEGPALPPDPSQVAPANDPTVATGMAASTAFLYTGPDPIQTGVEPGTIEPKRVAVLRGLVKDRAGEPVPGVSITVLDHEEFGQTLTREDGVFDMAVNGGGILTVSYAKEGYLPLQRQVEVSWEDFSWLPSVVMVQVDPQVTVVDLSNPAPMQVALGGEVTDEDGTRRPVLMVPQGTTATINLPDGTKQDISTLSFRATEYTVGPEGPHTMPAPLPPTSAYTYAVELSADEALTGGVKINGMDVEFSQPVPFYVDNFLGFSAGTIVPVGYYDYDKAAWIPYENGLVVGILSIDGGLANIDVDGSGQPADSTTLAALGITDAEREQLAGFYSPGQSLWRVQLGHLSTWDCNWNAGPPNDATNPNLPLPPGAGLPSGRDCDQPGGSVVGCLAQTLGESVPVTGTPYSLNYKSDRMPGRLDNYQVTIPLSGESVPASLERIDVSIEVAGQQIGLEFPPGPNGSYTFAWDGLDAYGRRIYGSMPATIKVGYTYPAVYATPEVRERVFAFQQAGATFTGVRARSEITVWKEWQDWDGRLGAYEVLGQGFSGWTLSKHHYYDFFENTLYLGTGETRSNASSETIDTVAGDGTSWTLAGDPEQMVTGPDGSVYFVNGDPNYETVRRLWPDGTITTVLGPTSYPYACNVQNGDCDEYQATEIDFERITALAIGPDESLYIGSFAQGYAPARVYRISPTGEVTKVAGSAAPVPSGDGGLATEAGFKEVTALAVAPDHTIYMANAISPEVRRIGPDGYLQVVAEGIWNIKDLKVGPRGDLYILHVQSQGLVKVLDTTGDLTNVAGNGSYCYWTSPCGDGGLAVYASFPTGVTSLEILADGSFLVAQGERIRRVDSLGYIYTLAGVTGAPGYNGDGGYAKASPLNGTQGISVGPDGILYLADNGNRRVRAIEVGLKFSSVAGSGNILVPSEDGDEVYVFEISGRHLQTINAITGAVMYDFVYEDFGEQSLLAQIIDGDGKITTIERDASGNPVSIVAPGGQRTELEQDPDGYLSRITNPAGESVQMTYHPGGLMASFVKNGGETSQFSYDEVGRLTRDVNPAGGFMALSRVDEPGGYSVTLTTAMDRVTTYRARTRQDGSIFSSMTYPNGASVEVSMNKDGTSTTSYSNGEELNMRFAPDPRFGLAASYVEEIVRTTPGGKTNTLTQISSAVLADDSDPLSLLSIEKTIDVNGHIFTSNYDNTTHFHTYTTPEGHQTITRLDELGRTIWTQSGGVDPLELFYDSLGRPSRRQQGDQVHQYTYDLANRLIATTDAAGNSVQFTHDGAGRVASATYPSGGKEVHEYGPNGKLTSLTMPSSSLHQLSYNEIGLLASYSPPGNTAGDTRVFNLDRDLERHTLPSGRTIVNAFDDGGRWLSEVYDEAEVEFGYEGSCCDQPASITRTPTGGGPAQTLAFGYDGTLPTHIGMSGAANGDFDIFYGDDLMISSITLQSGSDSVNTPIARDRDGNLTDIGPFTLTRGGPFGAMSQISDGTIYSVEIGYDSSGRIGSRRHVVNGHEIYSYSLERNTVGNVVQKIETEEGVSTTSAYGYDLDGQLVQVTVNGVPSERYNYDANGNRVGSIAATGSYDEQDRLTEYGGVKYTFDEDGFLTSRGSDLFNYSSRGELVRATLSGTASVTYHYDGYRRRVGRTDQLGSTYEYLYGNPGNIFLVTAARSPDGILTTYYYGDDMHLFAMNRGGVRYYIATDQLGTPRVVSNQSGTVVKVLRYDSFGVKVFDSTPSFDLPFGFAGGLEDDATGLVSFVHRDYDPVSGHWMARDPVLYDGGQANLYVYVGNDPVNRTDPLGLWCNNFSGYLGVGMGWEVCCKGGSCSFCGEFGVGYGLDLGYSALGDAKQDGSRLKGGINGGCGPVGGDVECSFDEKCGPSCDGGLSLGPIRVDKNLNVDYQQDFLDWAGKGSCNAQGKVAYENCASEANPLNGLW